MTSVEESSPLFSKVENLAYKYLKRIFQKNTLEELDITCDSESLQFKTESILQEVNTDYLKAIFVCKIDIFQKGHKQLAYYKVILNKEYQFLDEFFVTLDVL